MSIEFACPNCDSFLRTSEEKSGMRVRCPSCQEPIWVPFADELVAGDQTGQQAAMAAAPDNWQQDTETKIQESPLPAVLRTAPATFSGIMQHTWDIYTANLGVCIMAAVVDLAASAAAIIVATVLAVLCLVLMFGGMKDAAFTAALTVWVIGFTVMYFAIYAGNFRYFVGLARGRTVNARTIFVLESIVTRLIIGWAIFWILAMTGLVMLVVPGLLIMLLLWPFAAIMMDRNVSVTVAMKESLKMTSSNFTVVLGVGFIYLVLLAIGTIPVIGHLLSIPLASIVYAVSYLHLSGEAPQPAGNPRNEMSSFPS